MVTETDMSLILVMLVFYCVTAQLFFQVLEHLPRVLLRRQGQVGEDVSWLAWSKR